MLYKGKPACTVAVSSVTLAVPNCNVSSQFLENLLLRCFLLFLQVQNFKKWFEVMKISKVAGSKFKIDFQYFWLSWLKTISCTIVVESIFILSTA